MKYPNAIMIQGGDSGEEGKPVKHKYHILVTHMLINGIILQIIFVIIIYWTQDLWRRLYPFALKNSRNFFMLIQVIKILFVIIINIVQGTKLSLPGIAFTAKYNMFDQALPYVVTFSKSMDQTGFSAGDHIRKLFRNSDGGITNCYHRF